MNKNIVKIAFAALLMLPLGAALPVKAAAAPYWNAANSYTVDFKYLATDNNYDVSLVQDGLGNLTGNGNYPAGGPYTYKWVLTSGSVSGNSITFTADYTALADAVTPQATMQVVGTIAVDGTMSGTWSDNYQGGSRTGTWATTSGNASALGSIAAQTFGVVNYDTGGGNGILTGYSTDFGLTDAMLADIQSAVVQLYTGSTLLQTNISTPLIAGLPGTGFTSPFDVFGTFNYTTDGYWTNVRGSEYGQTLIPTKVVATVTLANGKVVTAENDNLTGDPATIFPATMVVTDPATGVAATGATVNGTNGASAADDTSFWLGTTAGGPFTVSTNPASELPSGWSGVDSGAQLANAPFSYGYTGLTPSTPYYFVAWSLVGGTWYPGAVLSFTTQAAVPQITITSPASDITSTSATVNGINGASAADDTSFWLGTTPSAAFASAADPTSELPAGWSGVDSGAQLANAAFSYGYTGLIPNTTYYFAAWSHADGIWYPGAILNFTTANTGTLIVNKNTVGGDDTFTLVGTGSLGTFTVTTASSTASREFDNLAPGNYTVTEPNVTSGWQQTDNDCVNVAVVAGEIASCTVTNTKIGTLKLGEIRGTKFEDRDGDGKLNKGFNRRLSGWTIYLDINNNGSLDPGEPSTVTNRSGDYRFKSLPADTYYVREVGQVGWVQTYPANNVNVVNLMAGKISKKNNFGNFKLGTISGMKFNDANGNRRKDSGEVGLQGWTINLMKAGSPTVIASTVTDASGNYSFSNLNPGTYQLREVNQTGWVQTTNNPSNVKVLSGAVSKNNNFGNHFGPVVKNHGRFGYDFGDNFRNGFRRMF